MLPALAALLLIAAAPASASTFKVTTNSFTFGQAPDWMPNGQVVWHDDVTGENQVYVSNLDGSGKRCLTCAQKGPNEVAQARRQGDWDIRVADFVDDAQGPHLTNVRIVRPGNGHYYETQHWAPDGKGFLYTESVGNSQNLELFWCHLPATGECKPERLTNDPAWDEQAIFTPDQKNVIWQ